MDTRISRISAVTTRVSQLQSCRDLAVDQIPAGPCLVPHGGDPGWWSDGSGHKLCLSPNNDSTQRKGTGRTLFCDLGAIH